MNIKPAFVVDSSCKGYNAVLDNTQDFEDTRGDKKRRPLTEAKQ